MIVTRTPLRISLVGGGTDMPSFYKRGFGAVVSFAIDKYIYVCLNKKFDGKTRISYSETECVEKAVNLKHDLVRESLMDFDVHDGVEVMTVADIPGNGTGLGSSSTLTVGLLQALQKYTGEKRFSNPHELAAYAYDVERELCEYSVGRQDHLPAAYGNLHYFQFEQDKVIAELINLNNAELGELSYRFTLLWTGKSRNSTDILREQEENMNMGRWRLAEGMRDIAVAMKDDLKKKDFSNIGAYLDANWQLKRRMATGISNEWIDETYDKAMEAGAEGGKICGAGGGGFFLFYGKVGVSGALEKATGLKHIPFKIETEGSKVIYGVA